MITIEEAIGLIPSWDKASSITVRPLSGGTTNRNYRVDVDRDAFVVRLCAQGTELLGIDRGREYRCAVAASRSGVAPEVVYFMPDEGITVTRFLEGRRLSREEAARPESLERVVQAMHRCHAGPPFEGTFSLLGAIDDYLDVARRHSAPLPEDIDALHGRVQAIGAALQYGRPIMRPCHNDLWWENLIDDGTRVRIVDWEYAAMGDACFDLAYYAMHHSPMGALDDALLRAYFGEVQEAMRARVQLLKVAAQLREALWYLVATNVANNPAGFRESAQTHFERYRLAVRDPRLPTWINEAAGG